MSWDDQVFSLSVSQIDEFLKRFNGVASRTFIDQLPKESLSKLKRSHLILSLIDRNANINDKQLAEFVSQITSKERKQGLNFYDKDWFARVECNVNFKGKANPMVITLSVETKANRTSKWVVRGVEAEFLDLEIQEDKQKFLHPASEGTDFMNLRDLFAVNDKKVKGFLYQNFHEGKMALFVHELSEGNITFNYIENITYHFLQIDDWAFEVHRVDRQQTNSGWLIKQLLNMDLLQKEVYKKEILYLD